jgi:heat shock protein HtpX
MRELPAADARRRQRSRRHSVLLLTAMAALLSYCGWIVADWQGILWSVIGGAAMLLMLRRLPPGVLLQALHARALARSEAPVLYKLLDELCLGAELEPAPLLCRVVERVPVAFTIGGGTAPTIVLSESLLQTMTGRELRGILAHEIIHLRNGDLGLMQLAMVVGRLTRVLSQIALMLVFFSLILRLVSAPAFPILPLLVLAAAPLGVSLLQLALSRTREAEADLEAAELTGDPYGLASALVKMRNREQMLRRRWSSLMVPLRLPSLFCDHPATDERIRRLMAMLPPANRNPAADPPQQFRRRKFAGPWG